MKLSLEMIECSYQIRYYDSQGVTINDKVYTHSLILMPEYLAPWSVERFDQLEEKHFEQLCVLHPQLVLLGTGDTHRFPPTHLLVPLINQKIGVEVMSTAAACRTYSALTAEGRVVAAALLFK